VSRNIRIALSVGVSLVFLGFAVRGVNWSEAGEALAKAHYLYVLPMAAVSLWTLYIRAQRWRVLLRPVGTPAMRTLVAATNIGFMANMVLPLRMGEVIRPVLLSRKENEPLGGILATIVLERIFDMFTVLFLFCVSVVAVPVSPTVRQVGFGLGGVAVVVGLTVAFIRWQEALALRLLRSVLRLFPARFAELIDHFFAGFIQALEILDSPVTFLQVLGWSLYLWLVIASTYLFGIRAFELNVPLVVGSVSVMAIIAVFVSAPSAPGYIGAFQAGCAASLTELFKVSASDAFAFSIVLHLVQFGVTVLAGLYSLAREGMSFRQIEQVSETDGAAA
jgi:uncharacterized protein (TIRG00374 family)